MKSIKQFLKLRYLITGCLAVVFAFTVWFGAGRNAVPANAAAIVEYKDEAIYKVGNSFRDKNGRYLLKVGDTATFTATQSTYSNRTSISWSISNTSVIQYAGGSSNSLTRTVRGVNPGVATLTGTIYSYNPYPYDYQGYSNPFPIRVVAPLSGATLSHTQMTLAPGATGKIDLVAMTPDSAYSLFVTDFGYTSSDASVATVDDTGNIKALKNGTTTISFMGDGNALAGCTLKVSDGKNSSSKNQSGNASGIKRGKITELSLAGSRALRIQIRRDKAASGYQIQYSTNKKFKKSKTKTVTLKKNKKTIKVLKKLKKGKKYYVRVRSFTKTRSGNSTTKKFGRWSKVMVSKKIK